VSSRLRVVWQHDQRGTQADRGGTAGQGAHAFQIQDYFHKEKNDPIKYMDLRLLLSEMPDAKLPEKELLKTVLPPAAPVAGAGGAFAPTARGAGGCADGTGIGGKLSISVDQVPAPARC